MFGESHISALSKIWRCHEEVRRSWRPMMVDLSAVTGTGKTLIVQEFFRRLAAEDPYWPPMLEAPTQRKAVVPLRERWHGEPQLFWLGLSCFPTSEGRLSPVLEDGLAHQLRMHAAALLSRRYRASVRKSTIIRAAGAIGALIGADTVRSLVEVLGDMSDARDVVAALLGASTTGWMDEDIVLATLDVADLINQAGQQLVVVLDDAHYADDVTLEGIERLLESARGVLVILTSWPIGSAGQSQEFDRWRQRLASTHRTANVELSPPSVETLADIVADRVEHSHPDPVDRGAALVLSERACNNPLVLLDLLDVMVANGLRVCAEHIPQLALLPNKAADVLDEHWKRFLTAPERQLLEVLAVLGSPVHEQLLAGAVGALSGADVAAVSRIVDKALASTWLTSIPDPYSEDRSLRFSEQIREEAARGHASELIPSTRERLVIEAATQALRLPARSSYHARTGALRYALELFEDRGPANVPAMIADLALELADLEWRGDPRRAAELTERAIGVRAARGMEPVPALLVKASDAWCNAGDVDRALAIFDTELPLMFAAKADQARRMERWHEMIAAVRDGIDAELRLPGSVAGLEHQRDEATTVVLADTLISAEMYNPPRAVERELLSLFWIVVKRLAVAGRTAEATALVALASIWGVSDPGELEQLAELGLPRAESSGELSAADRPSPGELAAMLSEGRFDEVRDELMFIDSCDGVELAQALVLQGGGEFALSLGETAMRLEQFGHAVEGFQRSLRHEIARGAPLDEPRLQPIRLSLAEALGCVGDGLEARTVAAEMLDIAERARDTQGLAKAQLAFGYAYLALEDHVSAAAALYKALERLDSELNQTVLAREISRPDGDRLRVHAALCDALGAQQDWAGISRLLDGARDYLVWGTSRHYQLRRGWSVVAQWHISGEELEAAMLQKAGLPPEPWALLAMRDALGELASEMASSSVNAPMSLMLNPRQWLLEVLRRMGHDDYVAKVLSFDPDQEVAG